MKTFSVYLLSFFTVIAMLTACGPSEQEQQQQREQARQDSLEQVRQQQLQQQRMDSIAKAQAEAQAKADSAAAAQEEEEENPIQFTSDGALAVQVEAWRSRQKAEAQISKWVDRGFSNAYVVQHGNPDTGDIWFRVRLGRVASKTMADRLGTRLQKQYGAEFWIAEVQDEGSAPSSAD